MALRKSTLVIGVDRETVAKLGLKVLRDEPELKTVTVEEIPNVIDLDKPGAKNGKGAVDDDLDELLQSGLISPAQIAYDAVLMYRTRIANERREEIKAGPQAAQERAAREAHAKALMERVMAGDAGAQAELLAMLAKGKR